MRRARRIRLALKARRHGARYARTILQEADRSDIGPALALALVEKESTYRNVFGHDPVSNPAPKGGKVTRRRYLAYKAARQRGMGMQGVGLTQLTWYEFQDRADRYGGCWKPRFQCRVAFELLDGLMRQYGKWDGIRRYNGSGSAAEVYAADLLERREKWQRRLFGGKA